MAPPDRSITEDGFETQFARQPSWPLRTHRAPLRQHRTLGTVARGDREQRGHRGPAVTFDDPQHTQVYRKRTVYRSSKQANLWPATLYASRQPHDVDTERRL